MRVAAVGVGVTTAAAIVVGVVAANRVPPTVPEPDPSITITNPPHPTSTPPAPDDDPPPSSGSVPNGPPGQQPGTGQPGTGQPGTGPPGRKTPNGQPPAANPPDPTVPPARGPLTEWPDEANTGVPPGTEPRPHSGDLHVDTAGAVVHDLWIEETAYVKAPNVTLRRVHVAPPPEAEPEAQPAPQAGVAPPAEHSRSGPGGGVLASTGAAVIGLSVMGVAALVLGIMLLLFRRRRTEPR